MTSKQKKMYKKELLSEELEKLPELKKSGRLYRGVTYSWIIFSAVYAAVTVAMLLYAGNTALLTSSIIVPVAAFLCVYFIGTGMKGIAVITIIGGTFEVFRAYTALSLFGISRGRMYLAYMIAVLIQGVITLGFSLFIIASPKIGQYVSALRRINNRIITAK